MIIINGYSIPHKAGFVKALGEILSEVKQMSLQFSRGDTRWENNTGKFDIAEEGGFAKVKGDRKALPLKAQSKVLHLVGARVASISLIR